MAKVHDFWGVKLDTDELSGMRDWLGDERGKKFWVLLSSVQEGYFLKAAVRERGKDSFEWYRYEKERAGHIAEALGKVVALVEDVGGK